MSLNCEFCSLSLGCILNSGVTGILSRGGHGVRIHEIRKKLQKFIVNPLMSTLKPQSNGPLLIGTLAVDGCAVTFGTATRGLGGLLAVPNVTAHPSTSTTSVPTSYYSMCHYNYLCSLKRLTTVNLWLEHENLRCSPPVCLPLPTGNMCVNSCQIGVQHPGEGGGTFPSAS